MTRTDETTKEVGAPPTGLETLDTSLLSSMSHAWRALRHPNFRLFFFGQSISLVGTWMTRLATSWLVYRMTHSPLLLGIVGFGPGCRVSAGAFRGSVGRAP